MFHRKRFKMAAMVLLTLLLTVATALIAAAQEPQPQPPPPPPPAVPTATPAPTDTTPDPGGGTAPTATPTTSLPLPPGNGGNGDMGNGDMGNGDMGNGDMMGGPPASWPPPNAIVHHAATPVQISALGGGLRVYLIAPDGAATTGPVLDSISALAEAHPDGDAVSLFSGTNAGSGKSVNIVYLPAEEKIRVITFYADKPPHDYNKPYIFTIDADHSVTHEAW